MITSVSLISCMLLLWSCFVVALVVRSCWHTVSSLLPCSGRYKNHLQQQYLFCLDATAAAEVSNKRLNETSRDWYSCGYEYCFIEWDLLWLNVSSFHTLRYFLMLKCFVFQGRGSFITTSKVQTETLEEDYASMAVGLWNNMVSSTTGVAYWT